MSENDNPIELLKLSSPSQDFFADLRAVLGLGPQSKFQPEDTGLTEITREQLPGRGLLYSFLVHEVAIIALLLLPGRFRHEERRFYEVERWLPGDTKLTYNLPELGGGQKGGGRPGGKSGGGSPKKGGSSPAPAPKEGGLVYPAPQPVISNPPNPTNRIQTILQPDLVKPPELKAPLPLPNIVKIARGSTLPAPPPLVPKVNMAALPPAKPPEAPKLHAELRPPTPSYALPLTNLPPPMEAPKLALPPATPEPPKEYKPIVPQVAQSATTAHAAAAPAPDLSLPRGAGGMDDRSLLVLSPTPGPPGGAANVPPGEARGQFAMGPEANLRGSANLPPGSPTGIEGGTGTGGSGTGAGGTGTGAGGPGSGSGEGGGGGGIGKGTGPGTGNGVGPGTGTGSGTGTGTGTGSGLNGTGGGGTGNGTGTGTGSGPGRGEGTGTGTGTGSGSGSGTNPFPGISIVGGTGPTGVVGGTKSSQPRPRGPTPTYGMTIVATASSGGGLRDYGIFRNEQVFTVYINMTHSETPAPSWTLQYAVLKKPNPGAISLSVSGAVQMSDHVVAPYPIDKEDPKFPTEVVARNEGRLIVVYAEITSEGKTENIRIIQSPNPLLNPPLIEALSKWTFRAADKNGQPVAVKALLGIPLSLPH
jgi:hypothetical protein